MSARVTRAGELFHGLGTRDAFERTAEHSW